MRTARNVVIAIAATMSLGAAGAAAVHRAAPDDARDASPAAARNGRVLQYWPDGHLKADVAYKDDRYVGEYRTWHASGRPYELKHFADGHEEGLQQAWMDDGTLYLNYEVRDGRRFGFVNAAPCEPVHGGKAATATDRGTNPPSSAASSSAPAGVASPGVLPYYDGPAFTPRWTPVTHVVSEFTVTTQTGASLSSSSLRGRPYVASFIYTQCAAICPLLVRQLARVQRAIEPGHAHIVSFSVMPDADTPERLAAFGRDAGVDPTVWSLVTGSRRSIYALARDSFFAHDTRLDPDDPTAFLHTEKLLLVDGSGHLRGLYNGTQPHAVDQLIADLAALDGQ